GDALDTFRVCDGGATVLLHDKGHACALLGSESGVRSPESIEVRAPTREALSRYARFARFEALLRKPSGQPATGSSITSSRAVADTAYRARSAAPAWLPQWLK